MLRTDNLTISPNFFRVDRIIVSSNYPPRLFPENHFIRLLQFFARTDKKSGTSYVGWESFHKLVWLKPQVLKNIDRDLMSKGIISQNRITKTRTYVNVHMLPVYDETADVVYQVSGYNRTEWGFKNLKTPFIKIPSTLEPYLLTAKYLSSQEKKVLLKLYRYNSLIHFGGVDCEVYKEENGVIKMAPRVYRDLYLSDAEFKKAIKKLISLKLLLKVPVVIKEHLIDFEMFIQYMSDHDSGTPIPDNLKVLTILRPVHQFKDDVEDVKRREGKGSAA